MQKKHKKSDSRFYSTQQPADDTKATQFSTAPLEQYLVVDLDSKKFATPSPFHNQVSPCTSSNDHSSGAKNVSERQPASAINNNAVIHEETKEQQASNYSS